MNKKIISLILLLCMALSFTLSAQARVTIPIGSTKYSFADYDDRIHNYLQIKRGMKVAHYFETDGSLREYSVRCPSFNDNIGSITISIYQWNNSYNETVSGTPLVSSTFTDYSDNANLVLHTRGYDHSGAYLVTFTNPVQTVGVWTYPQPDNPAITRLYVDNEVLEGVALEATYITAQQVSVADIERTARDAYTRIQAEDLDVKSNNISIASNGTTIHPNSSFTAIGYADINFGTTSPKGINMRVNPHNILGGDTGEIHIMLDAPEYGTKIAEIYFEYKDQIGEWITIPCNITTSITGKHDVYLVFYGHNYLIDWFEFSKTSVGLSYYDERLANFVPVEDSSLTYMYSDTWSATDMMGRKLPGYETVGKRDEERQIGMFYWTWHAQPGRLGSTQGTIDNNQWIIKNYIRTTGGVESDIKNDYSYAGWKNGGFWNESIYGYYHGLDSWVMRKHMELLSAAGVDGLFFDTTNGVSTWTGGYMALGKTIHEMRQSGIKTPQMSFILPFFDFSYNVENLRRIYQSMYGVGLYSDTWYYWDGKPVIMGYPDALLDSTGYEDIDALHAEIAEFFTFRPGQPSYFSGPQRADDWPWLEVYPQNGYIPLKNSKYAYECVSVGVAQNANDNGITAMNGDGVYGRSYTYKNRFAQLSEESKFYGYNFQEQWERAFELNPKMVFVTGWNEWTAGQHADWMGVTGAFPDQYNDEYSRDIEPTKGDFKDNYYYQLVANVRKFKGVSPTPVANEEKTIRVGGAFSQWDSVEPSFYGFPGGTDTREFYASRRAAYYYNDTGRNDIVLSKVARDADNLYFYVKTKENLTSYTDPSWMRLFINTDRTYKTGWEGYDFAVNIDSPASSTSATLSYSADGWNWKNVGTLTYKYSGNQMMIRVPREFLGLSDKLIDLEFKWIDNMQNQGDIMDVYNSGDSAPIGRFAYRYTETTEYDKTPVDEPVTVSQLKVNQHKHSVIMAIGKNTAFAGGKQKTLDVSPQLINDKTMLPLRFFSESFGAEVKWEDKTQTATVTLDGNTVEITTGKAEMLVNGESVVLESPACIENGRILIPMRDLAEGLGKQVLWVDGGLIIAGENPETVHSFEWVQDMTEDHFGIR